MSALVTPVNATGTRYGRTTGKFHLVIDERTVCGRDMPYPFQTTLYSMSLCARCKAKATPEQVEEANAFRDQARAERDEQVDAILAKNRAGRFVVHRCRTCGAQHPSPRRGAGVPWCMHAMHEADLESVDVTGEPWQEPSNAVPGAGPS